MQRFRLGAISFTAVDPQASELLAGAYEGRVRPLCACQPAGVPMYVAHLAGRYLIKRMPDSGSDHDPDCPSFEPPAELSGLGEVAGSAIVEDPASGMTSLKLDFALSRGGSRAAPIPGDELPDSVRTDGSKLTMRALVHYLWDEAGLSRWSPAMEGKRSWFVVRKYLLQAAQLNKARAGALSDILLVPETFSADRRDDIERRRLASLARLHGPRSGPSHQLMPVLGEVKNVEPARYGHRVTIKHLPSMPFGLSDALHKKLIKRFATELDLWEADPTLHLMMVATFGLNAAGLATVDEAALVLTTQQWLIVENAHELELVGALVEQQRRFTKGLRYNLAPDRPVSAALLTDTAPQPVALYIDPASASDELRDALDRLTSASGLPSWLWHAGAEPIPSLPAPAQAIPLPEPRALDPGVSVNPYLSLDDERP